MFKTIQNLTEDQIVSALYELGYMADKKEKPGSFKFFVNKNKIFFGATLKKDSNKYWSVQCIDEEGNTWGRLRSLYLRLGNKQLPENIAQLIVETNERLENLALYEAQKEYDAIPEDKLKYRWDGEKWVAAGNRHLYYPYNEQKIVPKTKKEIEIKKILFDPDFLDTEPLKSVNFEDLTEEDKNNILSKNFEEIEIPEDLQDDLYERSESGDTLDYGGYMTYYIVNDTYCLADGTLCVLLEETCG